MFSRRQFLKAGAGAASMFAANALPAIAQDDDDVPKPNILFILIDDLGKEWVSCYGAEDIATPNFDRLAATGMRFENAYSMPQCTPTRVALLTGTYPFRNGWINHWDVPRWGGGCHFDWNKYMTFARVMKSAGYSTCAAGKWQINDFRVQPDAMKRHGFDECCMWTGGEGGNPVSDKRYWDPYIFDGTESKTHEGKFGPDVFVEFLEDFMTRNRENPMLMYFPMCLTHVPFTDTPHEPGIEGKLERHKAMVRYTDYCVGRLADKLDQLGLRENTIIFLTTDNGTARNVIGTLRGRKVKGGKASLKESGINEPFIVNCPGKVPAGVVSDALTDFTDMLPTFAELGGAAIPDNIPLDGQSIAPLILGETEDSERDWIMAMGFGPAKLTGEGVRPQQPYTDRVIRDKRFKLWIENRKSARLYDLVTDPGEENDLIRNSMPAVRNAIRKFETVAASFPDRDSWPQYDPTPPQDWDRKVE